MKALLLSSYKNLELADLPIPSPGPDEVLIRVAACGICGSDVHGYDGGSGRRIPPIVMGHEAAGMVESVGPLVKNFALGDRVTFDSTVYCGACRNCLRGDINLCDNRQVLGVSCGDYRRAGAFAEFVAVPARILYRLPENFAFAEAAMLEAVAVAIHGVNLAHLQPNDSALVNRRGHHRCAHVASAARRRVQKSFHHRRRSRPPKTRQTTRCHRNVPLRRKSACANSATHLQSGRRRCA